MMKKIIYASFILFSCFILFAQENDVIEEISLPDVSTVISGGAPKVGKSAVSDFSDVLPEDSPYETVLPELPDFGNLKGKEASVPVFTNEKEKSVYMEGLAGAGYPGYITGNFSVYRQSGSSPFKVQFLHESANGYSGNALTSGYFDRTTLISAEKQFSVSDMDFAFSGFYESIDNGLQDKIAGISNVTQENLGANATWSWNIPHGFGFGLGLSGDWYKRYATITGDTAVLDYAKNIGVLEFEPSLYFSWGAEGFYSIFNASYFGARDLRDSFEGSRNAGRGDFGIKLGWKNQTVHLFADADAVFGNKIGDNDVVVPFTAGLDFAFNSSISSRKIALGLKGGIDSFLSTVNELEKKYRFSAVQFLPEETSDWFGSLNLSVPVKDKFTVSFDAEFRTCAYDNGSFFPDYDAEIALQDLFGQYVYVQEELSQFKTDLDFAFTLGELALNVAWKAYWIDVPCNESESSLAASVSYQNKTARFGGDASFVMDVASGDDHVPDIGFGIFWRLTSAVRLALRADDVVKLLSSGERTYAGKYITRSGNASLLVKFFF